MKFETTTCSLFLSLSLTPNRSHGALAIIFGILIIATWMGEVVINAGSTSCSTESVLEGHATYVRCQFSENITVHRHSLIIVRYDFNGLHYLPEAVLQCAWHAYRSHPTHWSAEGYELEGDISDTITLHIPEAKQRHSGRYRCDHGAAELSDENHRDLHVRGREISCTGATVYEGEPATVTCHFNSDLSITWDSFYINRLRPGHSGNRDVLQCVWVGTGSVNLICNHHPSFTFSQDEVSRTASLHIPAANQSHVGRYYCGTVPSRKEVTLHHCYVEVKARKASALSTSTNSTTSTTTATTTTTANMMQATSSEQRDVQGPPSDGLYSSATGQTKTAVITLLAVLVTQLL